jgi:hypothetical protein
MSLNQKVLFLGLDHAEEAPEWWLLILCNTYWNQQLADISCFRIPLAFEYLTPVQVCEAFSEALDRPCHYVHDKHIDIRLSVPPGYREQLAGIEVLFGQYNAPYFPGPDFEHDRRRKGSNDTITGRPGKPGKLTDTAQALWPGWRSISEYFQTAFLVEEEMNGKTWMVDKTVSS